MYPTSRLPAAGAWTTPGRRGVSAGRQHDCLWYARGRRGLCVRAHPCTRSVLGSQHGGSGAPRCAVGGHVDRRGCCTTSSRVSAAAAHSFLRAASRTGSGRRRRVQRGDSQPRSAAVVGLVSKIDKPSCASRPHHRPAAVKVLAVHGARSERGPDDQHDLSEPSVEQRRRR